MEQPTQTETKKERMKLYAHLVLSIIILLLAGYIYYSFVGIKERDEQARSLIYQAKEYDRLSERIATERVRCQSYVGEGSGEFGEFEYCVSFIKWVDKTL